MTVFKKTVIKINCVKKKEVKMKDTEKNGA